MYYMIKHAYMWSIVN